MLAFLLRRLLQSAVVLLAVGFLAFAMFRYVGDPVNQLVGLETSTQDREALRERLGLLDPTIVQFARFMVNAASFDFGTSYQFKQPVGKMIAERFPATMELSFISIVIALVFGIPMGVYTGLNRNAFVSRCFLAISLIGVSLPTFFIGILLIFLFSVQWGVLPSFGRGDVVDLGIWTTGFLTLSGIKSLILPAITLALFQVTMIMRLVRSQMLEVMQSDFIKFARARGIGKRSLHYRHALKNTLVPVMTITGLQIGSVIAFAIITENVFAWPGMGLLFLQAVHNVDIPIMAAYLLLIASLFVFINLIVDILYFVIDPRLRKTQTAQPK